MSRSTAYPALSPRVGIRGQHIGKATLAKSDAGPEAFALSNSSPGFASASFQGAEAVLDLSSSSCLALGRQARSTSDFRP